MYEIVKLKGQFRDTLIENGLLASENDEFVKYDGDLFARVRIPSMARTLVITVLKRSYLHSLHADIGREDERLLRNDVLCGCCSASVTVLARDGYFDLKKRSSKISRIKTNNRLLSQQKKRCPH